MPEHTRTRDGAALGATILFPGGLKGTAVGIDPHFLPKIGAKMEEQRLAAQEPPSGGAAQAARSRL